MVDFSANIEKKCKSRIKFSSIIFSPYHYEDLIQIVNHKYIDTAYLFEKDAIIFLCKKIANINSDVRLLERYYTEALHRHPKGSNKKITISDIQNLFSSQSKGIKEVLKPY